MPAFLHGMSVKLNQACSYTFVYNNLNVPVGTLPVTTVRPDEQVYADKRNAHDTITAAAVANSVNSAGLPVGVQVVGAPWREERVLGAMKAIETALHAAGHVPASPPM